MTTIKLVRTTTKCLLALVFTLGVPLGASAQMTYDEAVQAYYAANQIASEVWVDNPNQLEAARHAMMIARNWGIHPPGFEPSTLDPSVWDGDGTTTETRCIWVEDENGEWQERCSEYHTYGCHSERAIRDMTNAKDATGWFSWFYAGAAVYAAGVGQVPAGLFLGGISWMFDGMSRAIGSHLEQSQRC